MHGFGRPALLLWVPLAFASAQPRLGTRIAPHSQWHPKIGPHGNATRRICEECRADLRSRPNFLYYAEKVASESRRIRIQD
jgi:hypothetical protein